MRERTRIRRDDRTDTSADAEPGGARVVALVIVPMGALVIAPMGALIVALMVTLVIEPMVPLIAAPMDALVVASMDALVTIPMDTLVVAPVIAPMDALVVAPMVAVVITPMDALVAAPTLCGAGLLTMISRGRNECLHPRRSRDTVVSRDRRSRQILTKNWERCNISDRSRQGVSQTLCSHRNCEFTKVHLSGERNEQR